MPKEYNTMHIQNIIYSYLITHINQPLTHSIAADLAYKIEESISDFLVPLSSNETGKEENNN